jgi:hypothetical protein
MRGKTGAPHAASAAKLPDDRRALAVFCGRRKNAPLIRGLN